MDHTSSQVSGKLKGILSARKLHPRETYEDVIGRLLEDVDELDSRTKAEVRAAVRAGSAGRVKTHEQLGREMGF